MKDGKKHRCFFIWCNLREWNQRNRSALMWPSNDGTVCVYISIQFPSSDLSSHETLSKTVKWDAGYILITYLSGKCTIISLLI